MGRRLELRVNEGAELQMLRNHALTRGRVFLLPLGALPGMHPLRDAQEWEYTREVSASSSSMGGMHPLGDAQEWEYTREVSASSMVE